MINEGTKMITIANIGLSVNKSYKNMQTCEIRFCSHQKDIFEVVPNAAFTHVGLTPRCQTESFYKSIFMLSRSRNMYFMKRIECLVKTAGMKFEF